MCHIGGNYFCWFTAPAVCVCVCVLKMEESPDVWMEMVWRQVVAKAPEDYPNTYPPRRVPLDGIAWPLGHIRVLWNRITKES